MNLKDVVSLANSGFTASQIAALYAAKEMQPAQPQVQQLPAQVQQPVQVQQPAQPQAQQLPAWQPYGQQLFQQAAPGSPVFQPVQQPQTDPLSQVMAAIGNVQQTVQAQAIAMTQQPKPQTVDDIMAEIINPPTPAQPGQQK